MIKKSVLVLICLATIPFSYCQSSTDSARQDKVFYFKEDTPNNQASFYSATTLEDVDGLSTKIKGEVSINFNDIINSLKGKIYLPTNSLKTGISKRDRDLMSDSWLDAEMFPEISFTVKKTNLVNKLEENKYKVNLTGLFFLHGITKEISLDATLIYLPESDLTKKRIPGNLLGIISQFHIMLSDFNIEHKILGKRVSDLIEIKVNMVGTDKK